MTKKFKIFFNFLIFGRFKRKNPCAVGSNRRILDRNVVVIETKLGLLDHLLEDSVEMKEVIE